MRRVHGSSVVGFLFAAGLSLPAGAALIGFSQVDWLASSGGYTAFQSEWGVAGVKFTAADLGSLNFDGTKFTGYLNVVASVPGGATDTWAVQNAPVAFTSAAHVNGSGTSQFSFDLGIARGSARVSTVDYRFTIDTTPRATAPAGIPVTSPVAATEWRFGGMIAGPGGNNGGTGDGIPAPAQNFTGANPGVSGTGYGGVSDYANIPAVNEATNHCAPGGIARSLGYLANNNPGSFNLPPGGAQAAYNELRQDMNTGTQGTSIDNVFTGKEAYLRRHNLNLMTFTTTDPFVVARCLGDGADVEAFIDWGRDSTGKQMGGHLAQVTDVLLNINSSGGIDTYRMQTADDNKQGDGMAATNFNNYSVNFNNNLQGYYIGSRVVYFIVEKVPEPTGAVYAAIAGAMLLRRRECRNDRPPGVA